MELEQLMVGDWVKVYNPDHDKYYDEQVTAIREENGKCEIMTSGYDHWFTSDMVKPIPMTKEMLEKNGWINKTSKGWMQKGNFGDSPLMLWYTNDVGPFNPHFTNELEMSDLSKDGGFRLKIQCKYVHELQHALRLCVQAEFNLKI